MRIQLSTCGFWHKSPGVWTNPASPTHGHLPRTSTSFERCCFAMIASRRSTSGLRRRRWRSQARGFVMSPCPPAASLPSSDAKERALSPAVTRCCSQVTGSPSSVSPTGSQRFASCMGQAAAKPSGYQGRSQTWSQSRRARNAPAMLWSQRRHSRRRPSAR